MAVSSGSPAHQSPRTAATSYRVKTRAQLPAPSLQDPTQKNLSNLTPLSRAETEPELELELAGEIKTGPDHQRVAEWPGEFRAVQASVCLIVAELNHSSATNDFAEIDRAGRNPFNEILGIQGSPRSTAVSPTWRIRPWFRVFSGVSRENLPMKGHRRSSK